MTIFNENIDVFKAKIRKVGGSYSLVVPMKIIKCNDWHDNQLLKVWVRKDVVKRE